jgi:VanZ family protein
MGSSILAGWLASSGATNRHIDFAYLPVLMLAPIVLISLLSTLGTIAALPKNMRRPAWLLLIPVAMACLISVASSSVAGAEFMIQWVIRHLGVDRPSAVTLIFCVRKSIHVSFYGLLALSARTAVGAAKEKSFAANRFALVFAFATASFDELRQSTQPGRTGSAIDVLIDMLGAVAFLAIAERVVYQRRPRRKLSV